MENNYFNELNSVNVGDKIEKKNGLSYLSWAWAWGEIKKRHPDSTYTIYENKDGWNYFSDGHTGWVKTGVTVNGIEHIEYLPIMDFKNKSITADNITSFDVNKAIQRSLTKACARHGLGLYIYAGEDLPEDEQQQQPTPQQKAQETRARNKAEFDKRFKELWDYLHKPEPKWTYDIDSRFREIMKICTEKKYRIEECNELVEIFEKLPQDEMPVFEIK
jgi:hypothetical protein